MTKKDWIDELAEKIADDPSRHEKGLPGDIFLRVANNLIRDALWQRVEQELRGLEAERARIANERADAREW